MAAKNGTNDVIFGLSIGSCSSNPSPSIHTAVAEATATAPPHPLCSTDEENAETVQKRDSWSGPIQFFLTIIGYSIGLGNIYRFPYIVMENGGGI